MALRMTPLTTALLLIVALPAFAATAADDPRVAPTSSLGQALAFAPPGTTTLTFTDWDTLKDAHGLEILDSTLPEDLRIRGMMTLTESDGIFSGYGLAHLQDHAESWGWDSTDLTWEAQVFTSGAPGYVLRFRDDLDLGPFWALLDGREFESRRYGDALVRSHDLDLRSDWIRTTELAVQNVALMPDGHTMAMSGSPDVLEAMLDAAATSTLEAAASPAGRIVASLDQPVSAAIEIGPDACTRWSSASPISSDVAADADLVEAVGPLPAWEAMGVATYAASGDPPSARLVFVTSDPANAAAEAEARARLAREGHSDVNGEPYADIAFTVDGTSASDGIVSIDLSPVDERSRTVVRALFTADLLPARCDIG